MRICFRIGGVFVVFSSLSFLLFFLPAVLALYFCVPQRWRSYRNILLLIASFVFYGCSGVRFLALMVVTIVTDYLCGLLAGGDRPQKVRKAGVWLACIIGLGLLGYFKYAGFFTENLHAIGIPVPVVKVTLPIGISFFTFQGLSYVLDVYRGDAAVQRNPLSVALYIALFPQLVAGPIVRYTTVAEEIDARKENPDDFAEGFTRFCIGLGKKMVLANSMGEIADAVYALSAAALPAGLAWVGAIAYTFQIYFDFSAYSDMAIGLGRMFGFHFLENFNYPYIATSVTDFWRRWHISLSSWFRDYVYIPLGGSRCSRLKQLRNLAVVWLLTGFWHGAAWNYIFWGFWFLIFLVGEKYVWGKGLAKLPGILRWAYTMLLVVLSWVFFRSPSLGYAAHYLGSLVGLGSGVQTGSAVYYLMEYWPQWCLCIIACLPLKKWLQSFLEHNSNAVKRLILLWLPKIWALFLLALSYMKLVTGSFNPFIYFQF